MSNRRSIWQAGGSTAGVARYLTSIGLFAVMITMFNAAVAICRPFYPRRWGPSPVRRLAGWWTGLFLRVARALGANLVSCDCAPELRSLRGTLLVANHPSLMDAFWLLAAAPNFSVVHKSKIPRFFLGRATADLIGYLSNSNGKDAVREAVRRLRSGENLLVFPEGTRSEQWPVSPFTRGYALIARKAGSPIRPVAIETRSDLLSKTRHFLSTPVLPIRVRIALGESIDPGRFDDANALNRHVEKWFANRLATVYRNDFCFESAPIIAEPGRVALSVRIPQQPVFCTDHFPGNPILPAYGILLFCRHLAFSHWHAAPCWQWENVKFLRPILPGAGLEVSLAAEAETVRIELSEGGRAVLGGRLRRTAEQGVQGGPGWWLQFPPAHTTPAPGPDRVEVRELPLPHGARARILNRIELDGPTRVRAVADLAAFRTAREIPGIVDLSEWGLEALAQATPLLLTERSGAGVIAKVNRLTVLNPLRGPAGVCRLLLERISAADSPLPHFRGVMTGTNDFAKPCIEAEFKLSVVREAGR